MWRWDAARHTPSISFAKLQSNGYFFTLQEHPDPISESLMELSEYGEHHTSDPHSNGHVGQELKPALSAVEELPGELSESHSQKDDDSRVASPRSPPALSDASKPGFSGTETGSSHSPVSSIGHGPEDKQQRHSGAQTNISGPSSDFMAEIIADSNG